MPYAGNPDFGVCKQHRRRPACIYVQSDQRILIYVYVSVIYKSVSWQISTFLLATDAAQAVSLFSSLPETCLLKKKVEKKLMMIFLGAVDIFSYVYLPLIRTLDTSKNNI